jgi:hypothetical protein
LPFERADNIEEKFNIIKKNLQRFNVPGIKNFLEYCENSYIGIFDKPHFFADNWSVHDRIILRLPITTNICEGWNGGFNKSFDVSHPKIND